MSDSCATCFFGREAPTDAGERFGGGQLFCNRNAPFASNATPGAAAWLWPLVADDFWCGEYSLNDPNIYTQFSLEWASYSITVASETGALVDVANNYSGWSASIPSASGGTTFIKVKIQIGIGGNGTGATSLTFTLPSIATDMAVFSGFKDTTLVSQVGFCGSGLNLAKLYNYDGTYSGADSINIYVEGFYQNQ